MAEAPLLLWFRQDLRLSDNPALHTAAMEGRSIIPVFILDDKATGNWTAGGASQWWLHQSLTALNESLQGALRLYQGQALKILQQIIKETGADTVYWNRCYEPWQVARDTQIKTALQDDGVTVKSFNAFLLYEPWTVLKKDQTPYKVFTPFYRACQEKGDPAPPLPAPRKPDFIQPDKKYAVENLDLLPRIRWDKKMAAYWTPGEKGARARLKDFLEEDAAHYKIMRDRPDKAGVSRLSPHLHFGEISPRQIWHATGDRSEAFLRQLIWREFSWHLLHYNPDMAEQPLRPNYADFPWRQDVAGLKRWQKGLTGYPIVDAGMRELWETGWMHNRVRMIVASFLIKDLLIDWREGERWFWDCLVDADLGNNAMGWQWVAGCGADAAPFFRIFNPITQGEKFDPKGDYIRRWIPELKALPDDYIHNPDSAPDDVMRKAGIRRGKDYPEPVVDHGEARKRALAALACIKEP